MPRRVPLSLTYVFHVLLLNAKAVPIPEMTNRAASLH